MIILCILCRTNILQNLSLPTVKYFKFRAFEEDAEEATNQIPEDNYNGDDAIWIYANYMDYTGIGVN